MGKLEAYEQILESAALMQASISKILTAKAGEARQNQGWISAQLKPWECSGPEDVHRLAMEMHDQMVEIIDGITKMEVGIVRNLKALLNQEEESGPSGIGDLFGSRGPSLS